jgi:hypothetical protein|tara:strand:- start:18 stop:245 length:228 start_codon:yes stop_codon:yes gene_type:complete
MALVLQHLNRVDSIQKTIDDSAEKILEQIDLNKLLENTKPYLESVAATFLSQHRDTIKDGLEAGRDFANKIVQKI